MGPTDFLTIHPHQPRSCEENKRILAFLYSITTPQQESCYNFGTDTERICIDIGASACISTRRENFVNLTQVKNIKINGIGSGLPVEGSGLLKCPLRDENNNEVDLYIQNALFVPKAPMGLLCPQEVALPWDFYVLRR
jgi:hypothetical protein